MASMAKSLMLLSTIGQSNKELWMLESRLEAVQMELTEQLVVQFVTLLQYPPQTNATQHVQRISTLREEPASIVRQLAKPVGAQMTKRNAISAKNQGLMVSQSMEMGALRSVETEFKRPVSNAMTEMPLQVMDAQQLARTKHLLALSRELILINASSRVLVVTFTEETTSVGWLLSGLLLATSRTRTDSALVVTSSAES